MSAARVFKPNNPLAGTVGGERGLRVDTVLNNAEAQLKRMQDPLRASLAAWVNEILVLSAEPAPDRARLSWLANGVFGVAGACDLDALARCGGLLGRAIEAMGQTWRRDAAGLYAASMVRLLGGASKAEETAVLASLEAMTKRLADAP
ncbi:hypothetical protein [Caulobacter sp. NIBR1757]|uniref:hypothetical protein n=1 Tax=Caulobacter sp. NIBR1757 TaxID=3016000 RepID=UPI0022F03EAC|nr:hypothetical protein [Caulobacter sp. NIBR1757]WGM40682.1 hypothetical protein AMEJIAPC_03629 [Caulobacter sp. NIBR1757]